MSQKGVQQQHEPHQNQRIYDSLMLQRTRYWVYKAGLGIVVYISLSLNISSLWLIPFLY